MDGLKMFAEATAFAADKHRKQRRKGVDASPYINHPLDVARILASIGNVSDAVTLIAAVLHDTIEDTATSAEELEAKFGGVVRSIVEEVTDNKALKKDERKRLQIEHAPTLSSAAKLIKLADKISNVKEVIENPPKDWSIQRRREYLEWTEKVVAGCRGVNASLENHYDEILRNGHASLVAQCVPEGNGAL